MTMTAFPAADAPIRTYKTAEAAERAAVRACKRRGLSSHSIDASDAPCIARSEPQVGEYRTDFGIFRFDEAA